MGNPFTPDPTTPKGHGKYVERAQFLGETSRRIRAEQDPEDNGESHADEDPLQAGDQVFPEEVVLLAEHFAGRASDDENIPGRQMRRREDLAHRLRGLLPDLFEILCLHTADCTSAELHTAPAVHLRSNQSSFIMRIPGFFQIIR